MWDEEKATNIVKSCAKRKFPMFASFGDIGLDDLVSEGLMTARAAFPKFNPSKCAFSTFVYRQANSRIIDMLRARSADARRVMKIAPDKTDSVEDEAVFLPEEELPDLVASVLAQASASMPAVIPTRQGRPGFSLPQRAALLAMYQRAGETPRGMVKLLRRRPELCRAAGIRRPPSYKFFARLEKSGTKLRSRLLRITTSDIKAHEGASRNSLTEEQETMGKDDGFTVVAKDAAAMLDESPRTLARWRRLKKNLDFKIKRGDAYYRPEDIKAFDERRTVRAVA